ncbi:MAG: T9SS type A sorting domain-containing protein [Flavobacteriales bacterium]|nr:T9SS type A sorting domain-containing protein [Flavobacteriales bacterium]
MERISLMPLDLCMKHLLFCGLLLTIQSVHAQNVALNFDGSDDCVLTNTPAITGNKPRTVEAWIRTTVNANPSAGGKQKVLVDMGDMNTGGRFTFNLLYSNAIRLEVGGSGLNGRKAVNDGKWHHVAGVYDPKASLNFSLYVDGKLDTAGNIPTTVNTNATNDVIIGKRNDNTGYYEGDIDEVRIFDYARTDSAIRADMNTEYCSYPSGLYCYYKMNDGLPGKNNSSRKTAKDATGSGNKGTLSGFALSGTSSNWIDGTKLNGGDTRDTITVMECRSYRGPGGKNVYTQSGVYEEILTNKAGCDSIVRIELTIGQNSKYQEVTACDSFLSPTGRIVRKSGYFTDTFFNANRYGCDSILLTNLTIRKHSEAQDSASFCDSIRVDGNWFYSNFDMKLYSKNSFGCDSVITVKYLRNSGIETLTQTSACDSFRADWGDTYTQSGRYRHVWKGGARNGCDTAVVLDLNISPSYHVSTDRVSCDSFVSPTGQIYRSSGAYEEVFKRTSGCDSVITYQVTLNQSKQQEQNIEACDSFSFYGKWYSGSGKLQQKVQTKAGCDSLIVVDLTVIRIDTAVTRVGNGLAASEDNALYQWFECQTDRAISGATMREFYPLSPGDYYVELKNGSCTKRSLCFSTTNLHTVELSDIFPASIRFDQARGQLNVNYYGSSPGMHLQIMDMAGKVMEERVFQRGTDHSLSLNYSAGTYVISIGSAEGIYRKRILLN